MDGVLIDAREWHYEALNEALEIFGFRISEDDHKNRFDGLSTKKKLDILSFERNLPPMLFDLISDVKQDRTLRIAAAKCYPNVAHLILLRRLKNLGIRTGLVTNSIRKTTEFMLTYAGLLEYLDVIITNEDIENPKPSPEGYEKAMRLLGVLPNETIVVEDGEYGIEAAKKAGAVVLRVLGPEQVNLELLAKLIENLVPNEN